MHHIEFANFESAAPEWKKTERSKRRGVAVINKVDGREIGRSERSSSV